MKVYLIIFYGIAVHVKSSCVFLYNRLLYHVIAKRKIEVQNVKALNASDLVNYVNDMEFNITTISRMSCSQLRGLDNLVTGTPGSIYHRVSPLATFAQSSCYNTNDGPTISIRCDGCRVPRDSFLISWQFVDLPAMPAMAVGFQFNLTAKAHSDNKHVSFISGVLKNASETDEPITFRGPNVNILEFHLFPQLYRNFHDMRIIQPLFHQFVPGTYATNASQLQSSLQRSQDGLVNSTLYVEFLSDYVVEIDNESIMGPGADRVISQSFSNLSIFLTFEVIYICSRLSCGCWWSFLFELCHIFVCFMASKFSVLRLGVCNISSSFLF